MSKPDFNKEIHRILKLSQSEPKSVEAMGLKLMEEVGELAEALNHKLGNLPHKEMKEPLAGEVADVINVVVALFVKAHPELTYDEQTDLLIDQLKKKSKKWKDVIDRYKTTDIPADRIQE